ncbi:MAG: hypothetical protein ACHQIM_03840 [Sphingobacteriales bacterium]
MATLTAKKSIFDMSPEELEEYVRPVALKAQQMDLDSGAWFSYKNELCVAPDMFIHEFKDGHKELIKLGNQPGKYTVLKVY